MTTSVIQGPAQLTDDATFRAWGKGFSDQLAAVGLTRTADTGQIDWATALRPGTTSTAAGYEVWQFTDALQATAPIFFKVEYGTHTNTINAPGMWLTVGTSTNGSGTIGGAALTGRRVVNRNGNVAYTATQPSYFCFASGALLAASYVSSSNFGVAGFFITRSCDDAGNPTGEGACVYSSFFSSNTAPESITLRFGAGAAALAVTSYPVLIPSGMTSSAVGVDKQVFTHFASFPRIRVLHSLFTWFVPDFVHASAVDIDLGYGPRKYITLGPSITGLGAHSGMTTAATSLAFLWE